MDPVILVILLVAGLIGIGVIIYIRRRRRRQNIEDDPLSARLAHYHERELPASLEELELSLSFKDRVLVPMMRSVTRLVVKFVPQKSIEETRRRIEPGGIASHPGSSVNHQQVEVEDEPARRERSEGLAAEDEPEPQSTYVGGVGGYQPAIGSTQEGQNLRDEPKESPPPPALTEVPSPAETGTPAVPIPAKIEPIRETVQFSALHPKDIAAEQWHSLLVYAHLEAALDLIQQDAGKFALEMGGDPRRTSSRKTAQLARGTTLRIRPEGEGLEFNPPEVILKWVEDYERAVFRFRASADLIDQPAVGEIGIYTDLIEIARVRFSAYVTAGAPQPDAQPSIAHTDNPLMLAKLRSSSAKMYNRIFISYSRKDGEVARAYRLAQIAAGHEVFMDSESIRAGEDWQAALARAIDAADVFQLFWSEHSAASPNCCDEWNYALKHKCPQDLCAGFIRPVYWKKPLPTPPPELGHLNFRYVPFEEDEG